MDILIFAGIFFLHCKINLILQSTEKMFSDSEFYTLKLIFNSFLNKIINGAVTYESIILRVNVLPNIEL